MKPRDAILRCHRWPKPTGAATVGGFTLLEVLVALFVVAVALVAVYRLQAQTLMIGDDAQFAVTAPLLARAKIAQIDAALPHMPHSAEGDFGAGYPAYAWQMTVSDGVADAPESVAQGLKRIDLTVSFNGGQRRFSLHTFRFVP